jgi:iron complex outermembrane recepter protein
MNYHALSRAVWQSQAAVLAPCLFAGPASAAPEDECELDLPPGQMEASLLEIARQCNVVVSFRPTLLDGRMAPAIRGRFTARQAFDLVIQSSGLQVESTAGGALTVVAGMASTPPAGGTTAAAHKAPPAPAADDGAVALPPVVVTGSAPATGLRAARAWAATRSSTPLAELPQAVSVLTAEALDLLDGRSITDAASFIPGMAASMLVSGSVEDYGATGLTAPSVRIRGLPTAFALSGQRMLRDAVAPDMAFLDRIEVPKGPSGTVDGVADWKGRGGLVNLVLKEPGKGSLGSVTQSLSSRDSGTVRLSADVARPWNDSASWRLVGYAQQTGRTAGGYERSAAAGLLGTSALQLGNFNGLLTLHAERHRDTPPPAAQGGSTPEDGGESKAALLLQDEMSAGPLRLRVSVQHARTPTHDETWRDIRTGTVQQSMAFLPVSGTNWDSGVLSDAWAVKGAMVNVFDQRLFGPAADARFIPLQPGRSISLAAAYTH